MIYLYNISALIIPMTDQNKPVEIELNAYFTHDPLEHSQIS